MLPPPGRKHFFFPVQASARATELPGNKQAGQAFIIDKFPLLLQKFPV
jgi:hypothetical protein